MDPQSLLHKERTPDEELLWGLYNNRPDLCRQALEAGANPEVTADNRGSNALHFAVGKGYAEIVHLLIARGADLNYRNPHSQFTHVMLAVIHERPLCLELLLRHGADPNAACPSGEGLETPLAYALRRADARRQSSVPNTDPQLIDILLRHGAQQA